VIHNIDEEEFRRILRTEIFETMKSPEYLEKIQEILETLEKRS
jgi:hypothetical protein